MEELSIADYATGNLFPVRNVCGNALCFIDHGSSYLELRWYYSEPTTIFVRAGVNPETGEVEQDFVMGRDLLLEALRSGTGSAFPVIGEGNVMCQVLPNARALIAISFNEGFIVLAQRNELTEWVMGTYAHVPQDREEKVLDLDRLVAQLLYK